MAVCKSGECEGVKSEVKVYFVLGGGDDGTMASTTAYKGGNEGASTTFEGESTLEFVTTSILTTPVKMVTDDVNVSAAKGSGEESWKRKSRSVCDPNYSTPRSKVKTSGFCNHPVKRRLLFEDPNNSNSQSQLATVQMKNAEEKAEKMEFSDCCNQDKVASFSTAKLALRSDEDGGKGTEEEVDTQRNKDSNKEGDYSNLHHRRRRRKKKKRDENNTVVHVIGVNNSESRTITASTCSAAGIPSLFKQTEREKIVEADSYSRGGVESNKENSKTGDATTGAPPRRIAQLVVWTKNFGGGGTLGAKSGKRRETTVDGGKKETAEGTTKIEGKLPLLERQQQDINSAVENLSEAGGGKKENNRKKSSGSVADGGGEGGGETDLFFVQYPARPFGDQGKGKGKPFRRLNSYNDPIVIKKTPPPPVPSERKRRGGGGGEGKRKRNTSIGSIYPNKKESFKEVSTAEGADSIETSVVVVELDQQAQEAYHQAYLLHQQQQDFNVGQYFQLHQKVLYDELNNVVTAELPTGGEIISLPLQYHEEVVHCDYFPTANSSEVESGVGSADTFSVPRVTLACTASGADTPSLIAEKEATFAAIPAESAAGSGGVSVDSTTVFDLPERFTVTTNSTVASNEFDLLIQNVVHEELVNDDMMMGEEEDMTKYEERLRKRMRLSCGVETSEEEMLMMGMNGGSGGDDNNSRASSSEEFRSSSDEAGKPRCTYTELIEKALTESGGLTVSEIYNWISERYPYYRQDDDRWKNSVRHNLSINPYFKKGEKARSGAGHLWTISEESKGLRPSMVSCCDEQRRKSPCDPTELLLSMDNDTDRAVANILGMYRSKIAAEKGLKGSNDLEDGNCGGGGELNTPERSTVVQQHVAQCSPPPVSDASTIMVMNGGATCNNNSNITNTTSTSCSSGEQSLSSSSCSNGIGAAATITLNELNSGQFTVDLSGITIPEGGTINFDELVSNGRLIYIETAADPDANKENEQLQQNSLLLNSNAENILAELTGGGGVGHHHGQQQQQQMGASIIDGDVGRFSSNMSSSGSGYFIDGSIGLSLDLDGGYNGSNGEGKGEDECNLHTMSFGGTTNDGGLACVPPTTSTACSASSAELTMVSPSEVIAPMTTTSCSSQDYAILDQVFHPHPSYEVFSTSGGSITTNTTTATAATSSAAFYESKELGISYTYHQIDTSNNSASLSMASVPENNHLHHLN